MIVARRSWAIAALVGSATALVAVFSGLVASLGSPFLILILAGLISSVILLVVPLELFLVLMAILTFVVQGLLGYFLKLTQAAWIPYLLCAVALVRLLLVAFANPREKSARTGGWLALTNGALLLYLLILVAGVVLNRPSGGQVMAGFKNALPFWVIAALLLANRSDERSYPWMWRLFFITFFLQVPLVLFQHFYIRTRRADALTTGMDAVVGSFGGNITGGGASATLVMFTLFVMTYQMARFMRGRAGGPSTTLIVLVGLAIILSGEVKAVFVWLPLLGIYLLRRRLLSHPLQSVLALAATAAVVVGTFLAYDSLYWGQTRSRGVTERIERMSYFFDPSAVNYRTGEISRGASLALWANDNKTDTPRRIIGYGSGSTRVSATVGMGEVARRFAPLSVASTALATLLWDVGILGALSFAAILGGSLWMAVRLGNHPGVAPDEQARIEAIGAMLLICTTLLLYNRALIDEPSTQMLLAFGVGYVGAQWKLLAQRARPPQPGPLHPAGSSLRALRPSST